MTESMLPPALILIAASVLIGLFRGHARSAVVLIAPLLTLWAVWQVPDGVVTTAPFLDYTIEPVEGSPLRRLFATIFALMAFVGGLYAFRTAKWYELAAGFAYAAGAVGVSFAGDLITLFIFWEFMALFSTVVIWAGGTDGARRAGVRYAVMHLLGGVILKVGIEGVVVHTGSIDIQPMLATDFDTWMILIGILINAAAPPVSAWLADAYPEASPTGSVFLSAFTTKTAVLALILLFPGESVLIWVGLYMIVLRNHLRAAGKRCATHPRLFYRQPGRLHGLCGRYWHPDGAKWRSRARLRPHHLQGAAVHECRRGCVSHRQD
jgi:multicomponent Na+:H+ antiporter subunit D